ncbi:MAG: rhomboid family intramembrane serine protease [Acidobacteriota bacterium]
MFPYHDENETERTPVVTLAIIALCVLAWVGWQGAGSEKKVAESVCNMGLVAGELTGRAPVGSRIPMGDGMACVVDPGPEYEHILTSMFLHGSWMHLLGNMWFLWLFGNNIEDSMTRPRFAVFYLLSGLAAALLQVWTDPSSPVPMVGASGAISGVMGGYLILYPRVKVYMIVPLGFWPLTFALPAWMTLIYWALLQLLGGFGGGEGGVAFWAHVGGFLAGMAMIKLFARRDRVAMHTASHWRPAIR